MADVIFAPRTITKSSKSSGEDFIGLLRGTIQTHGFIKRGRVLSPASTEDGDVDTKNGFLCPQDDLLHPEHSLTNPRRRLADA